MRELYDGKYLLAMLGIPRALMHVHIVYEEGDRAEDALTDLATTSAEK
jgi:hypothetical protein